MKTYRITYDLKFHDPPLPKSLLPEGHGAADRLIVLSMIGEGDNTSYDYASVDGVSHKGLEPDEMFKAWVLLGLMLSDLFPEGDPRRLLPRGVLAEIDQLKKLLTEDEESLTAN